MKRLIRTIEVTSDVASGHFTGWLIVLMMSLVCVEVVSRYVFNQALMVGDEFSSYMLVAISFIGLAYVSRKRGHIRILFIFSRLRPKVRQWLRLVTLFLGLIFYIVLAQGCYQLITYSFSHDIRSPTWLRIPVGIPQILMIVGATLICLQLMADIISAVSALRKGEPYEC